MRSLVTWTLMLTLTGMAQACGIVMIQRVVEPVSPPPPIESLRPLRVKSTTVRTTIDRGVASTHVDQIFQNETSWQLEGEYMFFLPSGATVDEFALHINGEKVQGELLEKEKARDIYEGIVRRMQDPALLEYMGKNVFKARIFPIPANGERRIELKYKEVLPRDFDMAHYLFPIRTPKSLQEKIGTLDVEVTITDDNPVKNLYSPTHAVKSESPAATKAVVSFKADQVATDQDFSLYYSTSSHELGINLVTYKPDDEEGYFLLLLAPPAQKEELAAIPKDIVFVMDTSGSMAGERIEQARQALRTCVSALEPTDRFNVITFATEAKRHSPTLMDATEENVRKANKFIDAIKAIGGTNINEGLTQAFEMQSDDKARPFMVCFITDGDPTVGVTDPKQILANVKAANKTGARIFSIGVGEELNVHLVDEIARENKGYSEYIKPKENIEIKVSQFYRRISSPVLTEITVDLGKIETSDVYPKKLDDLFFGMQLTMVGRYSTPGPTAIVLKGKRGAEEVTYTYDAKFAESASDAIFLPSIWANRKVGYLLDEIRLHGENQELKDEVIRLAKQYAIVTPYTSYLVVEDAPLAGPPPPPRPMTPGIETRRSSMALPQGTKDDSLLDGDAEAQAPGASGGFSGRDRYDEGAAAPAMAAPEPADFFSKNKEESGKLLNITSGARAVEASEAVQELKTAGAPGRQEKKSQTGSKTVGSRTFMEQGGQWVDTSVKAEQPVVTIKYGSDSYFTLMRLYTEIARYASLGKSIKLSFKGKTLVISETAGESDLDEAGVRKLFE